MNSNENNGQWISHTLSSDYFYNPEESSSHFDLEKELLAVDFGLIDEQLTFGLNSFSTYYFPLDIIQAVRNSINSLDLNSRSLYTLGNLVYLFFKLKKQINLARNSTQVSRNQHFVSERKKLLDFIDQLENSDCSLLSVNIKMDLTTTESDINLKDKDVIEYLKQLILAGSARASKDETMSNYYKNRLMSLQNEVAYKAIHTVLPLKKAEFKTYYLAIKASLEEGITMYTVCHFMAKVLLDIDCIDKNKLGAGFENQNTYPDLTSYLQQKIIQKIA